MVERIFLVKTVNKEEKAELDTHLFPNIELTKEDLWYIKRGLEDLILRFGCKKSPIIHKKLDKFHVT